MTQHKTLAECKDKIALQYGYKDFDQLMAEQDMTAWANCEMFMDKAAELYASQFVKKEVVSSDVVEDFKRFIKFLCGETDYDGVWFGEYNGQSPFWWRTKLRDFENIFQSTQQPTIEWLTDEKIHDWAASEFGKNYSHSDKEEKDAIRIATLFQDLLKERVNCVDVNDLLSFLRQYHELSSVFTNEQLIEKYLFKTTPNGQAE